MIEFQVGDRRTGKTTQLLEWMKRAPEGERRIMVCATDQQAHHAYRRAKEMKMEVILSDFISYEQCKHLHGHSNIKLGIDNIDLMLGRIFNYPVEFVTATGEDTLRMIT